MVSVALFKGHRKDNKRRGGTIVSSAINKLQRLTFSPAAVRCPLAASPAVADFAAVAETARDIRRSLLPLIFPPEQSATRRSLCRNADRLEQGHHRTSARDANRSISHGPRCAPFRKNYRAFPLRSLT